MFEIFGKNNVTRAVARARGNVGSAINCVLVKGIAEGNPRLIATDGSILGVIPLRGSPKKSDVDGLVDREAFERAMSGTGSSEKRKVEFKADAMEVHDDKGNLLVSVPRGKITGEFPDVEKVIPTPRSQAQTLRVSPSQLGKLTAVLGVSPRDGVTLHFDTDEDGICRTPVRVTQKPWAGNDVPHGCIMPMQVEAADRAKRVQIESVKELAS